MARGAFISKYSSTPTTVLYKKLNFINCDHRIENVHRILNAAVTISVRKNVSYNVSNTYANFDA